MTDLFQNRTALITGASSGIGEEFAKQLAARGMHLVLVARSADKLDQLAASLTAAHGVNVSVIAADLSVPDNARNLAAQTDALDITVDLLINNAGFGTHGAFTKQNPDQERSEVLLNALAPLEAIHAFLPGMRARGHGGIINVASSAGFQPTPFMSVYGATKAFLLHLSEGLWAELGDEGIHVMALCPGPVATNFFEASGSPSLKKAVSKTPLMDTPRCVSAAIKGYEQGKSVVVPGVAVKMMTQGARVLPRGLMAKVSAKALGPRRKRKA